MLFIINQSTNLRNEQLKQLKSWLTREERIKYWKEYAWGIEQKSCWNANARGTAKNDQGIDWSRVSDCWLAIFSWYAHGRVCQ